MPARMAWTSASLLALPVMKLRVLRGVGMIVYVCVRKGRKGAAGGRLGIDEWGSVVW